MYKAKTDSWYLERVIWIIAGIFILLSITLAQFFSIYWLLLTALIGINLIIFGFTGYCLMANILTKLGLETRIK